MLPVNTTYPDFEANQVLTNENLNQMRDYLDEQTRLTRANFLGIGIACGLDYTVEDDGSAIVIYKGVGVTSAGYLIAACEDSGRLEYYKPYTVPDDISYSPFFEDNDTGNPQYTLWELDSDHNDDPEALPLTLDFLSGRNMPPGSSGEKVLLLFLECLAVDNRNCSPNSCDDKGQAIETTIRRLLIRREDLGLIQEQVMELGAPADEYFGLTGVRTLRNSLPELKMRRFDVEASTLVYSADVFDAFQSALNAPFINRVAGALSDLYLAFRPVLQRDFPANPFAGLAGQWAYLHNGGIVSQNRHLWMQYFYDHIFTVIQAYNEFREKGLELLGLCCPDARLFPRHLMLGIALPDTDNPDYRHHFAHSPLFARYAGAYSELLLLFRRLVQLIPSLELPPAVGFFGVAGQTSFTPIKITPSKLGGFPLSKRAIPYHYHPVPLFEYWDPQKTRRQKAQLNLGYRSPDWNTTDDFVWNPLRYDHEADNFYRIEGHLGGHYIPVLQSLVAMRNRNRLPFDVVALRTGRNANGVNITDDVMECNFQDLEAIYDTLREELMCRLCESVQYFYDTIVRDAEGQPTVPSPDAAQMPALALLRNCAPDYRYRAGTVGAGYEAVLTQINALPYQDLNPGVNFWWVFGTQAVRSLFVENNSGLSQYQWHAVFIYYLVELSETLSAGLSGLNFDDFANKYRDLRAIVNVIDDILVEQLGDADPDTPSQTQVDWDEVQDQLTNILAACKLEPIEALREEYRRRFQEIRERYLLSFFARQHPGLQHKAGVPAGGTFIIVYHGIDKSQDIPPQQGDFTIFGSVEAEGEVLIGAEVRVKGTSIGTVTDLDGSYRLRVTYLPVTLVVSMQGYTAAEFTVTEGGREWNVDLAAQPPGAPPDRYPNLIEGRVIADFYLPYLCCSDCQPITIQLPPMPLSFDWEQVGCTVVLGAGNAGNIRITPAAGIPPYQYSLDGGASWQDLGEDPVVMLEDTKLVVRDADGTEAEPQAITLKPRLSVELGERVCNEAGTEYTLDVMISGGTPPYSLLFNDVTTIVQDGEAGRITLPSGDGGAIAVEDSDDPPCAQTLTIEPFECPTDECTLPCGGAVMECDYLFWMQPPTPESQNQYAYVEVQLDVRSFLVRGQVEDDGTAVGRPFTDEELERLAGILRPPGGQPIRHNNFLGVWRDRVGRANEYIQSVLDGIFDAATRPVFSWAFVPPGNNLAPDFAFLRIEAYDCYTVEFEINVRYMVLNGALEYSRTTLYANQESTITATSFVRGDEAETTEAVLPGMNCVRTNRCEPDEPPVPLCSQQIAPPEITTTVPGEDITVEVQVGDPVDHIYVEFHYGLRLISTEENTGFDLPPNYPATLVYARALVINSDTCASSSAETTSILI